MADGDQMHENREDTASACACSQECRSVLCMTAHPAESCGVYEAENGTFEKVDTHDHDISCQAMSGHGSNGKCKDPNKAECQDVIWLDEKARECSQEAGASEKRVSDEGVICLIGMRLRQSNVLREAD